MTRLGRRLRLLRNRRALSQEKFAFRAGLHPTYISGVERGARNLGFINVGRIAKALGVSVSRFTQGV